MKHIAKVMSNQKYFSCLKVSQLNHNKWTTEACANLGCALTTNFYIHVSIAEGLIGQDWDKNKLFTRDAPINRKMSEKPINRPIFK